ncbi:MAG: sigma-70 family RNA polymerase sigma factor [Planctomycetes bacterium]|nr:sigma-70 family RNA polymerase sigma factor [Planctomycetota bacterium]
MDALARDFADYVDRGDPAALGRVFDATAGRLSLLAAHLAGGAGGTGGTGGDDLVQATFLAAMRRCRTWDRERPLWPWLAAILQNEARMLWRRQRVRREVAIDAAADRSGDADVDGGDPALLAANEEVLAAVARAIDELPVDHRQVMRLRVVHGLEPIEIARALELPVGTVRVRLHRARQRLQAALPAGIAGALAALLGGGDALAQVRVRILSAAGAARVAGPAGAVVFGGVVMKKVVAVALVLVALAVAFAVDWRPADPVGTAGETAQLPAVAVTRALREPDVALATTPAREAAPPSGRAREIVVKVLTPERAPIRGARVVIELAPRGPNELPRDEIAVGETDAEGTFRCAVERLASRPVLVRRTSLLWLSATAARCVPGVAVRGVGEAIDHDDAIEICLEPGLTLTGTVVDAWQNRVGGARFWGVGRSAEAEHDWRTADDGSFRIVAAPEDLLFGSGDPSRRFDLVVDEPRHGTARVELPTRAAIEAAGGTFDLGTVQLAANAEIRGRVELGDGSPLADFPIEFVALPEVADPADSAAVRARFEAALFAPDRGGSWRREHRDVLRLRARTRTAADGTFRFTSVDPASTYGVGLRDTPMGIHVRAVRAGQQPVTLTLDLQLVRVAVKESHGAPLLGANVSATGWPPGAKFPTDVVFPGFPAAMPHVAARFFPIDRDGCLLVLSPFGWVWRIGPFDEWVRPEFVRHDAVAGQARAEIGLWLAPEGRFGAVELTVVGPDGAPVASSHVVLRGLDREIERRSTIAAPVDAFVLPEVPVGRWRLVAGVGRALRFDTCFTRGEHEREIVVREGETTVVRIEVPRGGIAQLALAGVPDSGCSSVAVRRTLGGEELPFELAEREYAGPRMALIRPGTSLLLRELLPVGRHTLFVEVAGCEPTTCEVEITDGDLAHAEVELVPR